MPTKMERGGRRMRGSSIIYHDFMFVRELIITVQQTGFIATRRVWGRASAA